jgi:hypothetical protein
MAQNYGGGMFPLNPDMQLEAQDISRRRALADMLTANSLKPIDPMQNSGKYITPISPVQGLAQLGQALLAAHSNDVVRGEERDLGQRSQQQMINALFGTPTASAPPPSPSISSDMPQSGGMAAADSPLGTPQLTQGLAQQPVMQRQGGILPAGVDPRAAMLAIQLGQGGPLAMKAFEQGLPTEANRTLSQQGVDPRQMGLYVLGKARNDATFTAAPGSFYHRPGEAPTIAPDIKNGLEAAIGPDGRFITRAMQGAPEARAAMQGAETRAIEQAKAETELVEVYDPATRSTIKAPKSTLLRSASSGPSQPTAAPGGMGGLRPQTGPSGTEKAADANVALVDTQFVNKTLPALIDKSNAARDGNAQVTALRSIVASPKFETGAFVESKAAFGNALAGLGLATKDVARFTSDVQRFQLITTDMALNKQLMQSGVQTEGDSKRTFQTIANLQNTPAANAFALDWMEAVNNAQIKKAEFFEAGMNAMNSAGKPNFGEITDAWRRLNGGKGYSIWQDPILQKYAAPKAK